MIRRCLALAAALAVGAALAPSPADAAISDGGTYGSRSWGAARVDIDLVSGGQWIGWWLDDIDPPADGYCVRLYVEVLAPDPDAGWRLLATSCGPAVSGAANMLTAPGFGPIGPTVRVVRGWWGGTNFSLFNSMV